MDGDFIRSMVVRYLIHETDSTVVSVDKLTHSDNPESLKSIARDTGVLL